MTRDEDHWYNFPDRLLMEQKIRKIREVLDRAFPEPRGELNHSNPLELLIATILSAQCTDKRVNQVTVALFNRYKRPEDYAGADPIKLSEAIRPTGFYKNKAKNIIGCCQALVDRFEGEVPKTMEELVTLSGVGRKTASVILGHCFAQAAIVVDTHVLRVSRRLELTSSDKADVVEQDLARVIPKTEWTRFSNQLLLYGRTICEALKPSCSSCDLKPHCSFFKV